MGFLTGNYVDLGQLANQKTGDIPYAPSPYNSLVGLGIGAAEKILRAPSSGSIPEYASMIDVYRALFKKLRIISIPSGTTGWTETVVGSGISALTAAYARLRTGTTASSSIIRSVLLLGLRSGSLDTIDFSKQFGIFFMLARDNSDAEAVGYLQIKAATTAGDLAAAGLGIKVSNLTLVGESYGTSRNTQSLATLVNARAYAIFILHDPTTPKIEWYVDGVLSGTESTAANIPTGQPNSQLVISHANGVTGAVNADLYITNLTLMQEI